MISEQLSENWQRHLKNEINSPNFTQLNSFLGKAYENQIIYPPKDQIFNAFQLELEDIKVVILGQDPYHSPGQAHGFSFSVPEGISVPKSLVNIYKELQQDVNKPIPTHGNLTHWANQGVFLLNAALTVEKSKPSSHQKKGWLPFTDRVIEVISKKRKHIVFILWGKFAESKKALIDEDKHLILTAPHPSPLSAYRGFFGCQHFSKANIYLRKHEIAPIKW